jgi:RNA polymerase sigma-70 factor (ECF subfamily)
MNGQARRAETSPLLPGSSLQQRRMRQTATQVTEAKRFDTFVRQHQDLVYALACRLLGRVAEAEDVAQTVFLKAFEHFGVLDGNPAAPAWLRTATRNACLNHLARYRRRWRFFSELASHEDTPAYEAGLPAASAIMPIEAREEQARLEAALRALPDHQRVPLVLFHFEDASYQEIADLLGVSLGKVKTDIHRGRAALRPLLATSHASR